MKIYIVILLLLISTLASASPLTTITSIAQLRSYLQKKEFSGVILVADKERVIFKEAFGYRNLITKEKLQASDIFQIGSNTKQMVAMGLLKLQDDNQLNIDAPLKNFLKVPAEYQSIKIRDLLNHTSGITNYTEKKEFWELAATKGELSLQEIIDFTVKYELDFKPLSSWKYSNSGYIFAGKIIEDISGKTWDRYLNENIFAPLNMKSTGHVNDFSSISPVKGHMKLTGSIYSPVDEFSLSWAQSAGSLYSTAEDLSKYLQNYSQNIILTEESLKDMLTPFKKSYGLGVTLEKKNDDLFIQHNGRTPGFVSSIGQLKNRGLSIVALDNKDGAGGDLRSLLYDLFVKGRAEAISADSIDVSEKELMEYEGSYASEKLKVKVYLKEGSLVLFPEGQIEFPLRPISRDNFELESFAAEEFIRDENGQIKGINHYQSGEITYFQKL